MRFNLPPRRVRRALRAAGRGPVRRSPRSFPELPRPPLARTNICTEVECNWLRCQLSVVIDDDGTLYRFTSRVRRRSAWPPAAATKPSRPANVRNRDRPAVGPIGGQCSDFAEKCEPNRPFWRAAVASPRARHRRWGTPGLRKRGGRRHPSNSGQCRPGDYDCFRISSCQSCNPVQSNSGRNRGGETVRLAGQEKSRTIPFVLPQLLASINTRGAHRGEKGDIRLFDAS